ncbi:MAG: potassium transporter Kup [Verrucomicrobiota bacterium]|nr:potassium transporter Kup [Verrucomicrobiota bacterium]
MDTHNGRSKMGGLVLGALGVVYGDIGTSPLYALRECFHGSHKIPVTPENVLGVLSLIFWSLTVLVSIKYLTFVMRAANKGEGGILSLMSLAFPDRNLGNLVGSKKMMIALGIFGAALLYGDGMITPAITILGAVEGLNVVTTAFEPFIIPITIGIILAVFMVQKIGTSGVGRLFGPVICLWFLVISVLGIKQTIESPAVLAAVNPVYGIKFLFNNGWAGFVVLGAVFLCVTGGEALYADMGHFGRKPIRRAWFTIVMPALFLNYLGQGSLLLENPEAAANPFYQLSPKWFLTPLVILATSAAVIASQALISGAYSLSMQAIQLGYSPRLEIEHTSQHHRGQIYMPKINWILMCCCIGLVLGFRSSTNLAAAYGIAVTLTMLITTVLFYFASQRIWGWSKLTAGSICAVFIIVEGAFCAANLLKIAHGGWFPLAVGLVIFTLMSTWKTGRRILGERLRASSLPYEMFLMDVKQHPPVRVSGTAIFMAGNSEGTPLALLHNLKHNKVLHERVVLLTISTEEVPHMEEGERVMIENLEEGFYRVRAFYGFMEDPNVPEVLEHCRKKGLELNPESSTFFLSRETIIPSANPGMMLWRERLFAYMSRNAQRATAFFHLPANRVVELGMQVEI